MAKSTGQKLKLLYIIKILSEETDERHPMPTKELIERLAGYGIGAERKSIYSDMEALRSFGYDILQQDTRNGGGYYLASREFELAELKLLVDAVQSSRFITQKKSRELIGKLEKLTGRQDAGQLQRQVFVAGRVKTENERIYYHVDTLHRAIQENRQITFSYLEWNAAKQLVPRKDGRIYQVSPWALIWQDERYYLAAYDAGNQEIRHYRVDKLADVKICPETRVGQEQYDKLDLADYTNKTFGMFGGREEMVTLAFPEQLSGVIIDRFGKEISLRRVEGRVQARVKVAVSNPFYGWLMGIGKQIEILAPEAVRGEYAEKLEEIRRQYV